MCGLVGIAGDTTGVWKDIFAELLLIDVVRGPHSTGVGFVGRGHENFSLVKRPGHPFNLFASDEYEEAMSSKHSNKVLMGHNRFATIGEKSEANAHPFMFEHVIGAHNGTLDNWVIKDLHNHALYDTDSQAIFANINEKNVDETMKLVTGAWALVWFDKRDGTLNMLRNSRRPLHYAYSLDRQTIIWASEESMLRYVLGRRNKPMLKNDKGEDQIFQPIADTLYTWKIPNAYNKKLDVPDQREVKGKTFTYGSHSYFGDGSSWNKKKTNSTSTTTAKTRPANPEVIQFEHRDNTKKFRPPYKDQYDRVLNKKEYLAMVNEGCVFCNSNGQKWGEFVHILGKHVGYHTPYVCESCFNSEEQFEILQYAI